MTKYVSRKESKGTDEEWWEDSYWSPLHVPSVDDASLIPTGLFDVEGVPLWRQPNPIGFGRKFEW